MSDRVRMTSKTVFQNERVTVFRKDGPPEGEAGIPATVGDEFETDLSHGKELDRLGLADPLDRADLDGEGAPLEPHYTVSVQQLQADRARRERIMTNEPSAGGSLDHTGAASTGFADGNLEIDDATSSDRSLSHIDLTGVSVGFARGPSNDLDGKTNAELRQIAQAETIDLGELKRKDAIVAAIRAARTAKEG